MPSDFRGVINYLQTNCCPIEKFISRIITPQEAETALNDWASAPGKVFRILVKFA
jgi:hypothetical protein